MEGSGGSAVSPLAVEPSVGSAGTNQGSFRAPCLPPLSWNLLTSAGDWWGEGLDQCSLREILKDVKNMALKQNRMNRHPQFYSAHQLRRARKLEMLIQMAFEVLGFIMSIGKDTLKQIFNV